MTRKLEIRHSGEVGFVDGYMMAVVYPVPECPQSKAERDFNVKRMVDSWNNYHALLSLNAELLEAFEVATKGVISLVIELELGKPATSAQIEKTIQIAKPGTLVGDMVAAIAKARSQS